MTKALREPRSGAAVAFQLVQGDTVAALEGHIRTTRPGLVVFTREYVFRGVTKSDSASKAVSVRKGDTVYVTAVSAEATDASLWYREQEYALASDLNVFGVHSATAERPYEVISLPSSEWWVKVRKGKSVIGWVRDPNKFGGAGRCS
jgi:hypothetical protein